jgi:hypothetical protein
MSAPDHGDTGEHIVRDVLRDLDERDTVGSGISPLEADARRVLDHWLNVHREAIISIERRSDEPRPVFADRVAGMIQMHLDLPS